MRHRWTITLLLVGIAAAPLACREESTKDTADTSAPSPERSVDPFAAVYRQRAEMKIAQGQLDEAAAELEQGLKIAPDDPRALYLSGRIAFLRAKYAQAIEHLAKARALTANDPHRNLDILYLLAEAYLQSRKHERAEATFLELLKIDEKYGDAAKRIALLYVQTDNIDRALPALERARQLFPTDVEVLLLTGIVLRDRRRIDESLAILTDATELAPLSAKAHYELGLSLRRGDRDVVAARRAFERVVELDPIHDGALYQLVQMARAAHDPDEAKLLQRYTEAHASAENETNLRNALDYSPERPDMLFALAIIEAQHQRLEDAERIFTRVLLIDPTHREAATNLGRARMRLGRFAPAVAPFRRAVELQPGVILNSLELAEALQRAGDADGAIAVVRDAEQTLRGATTAPQPIRDDQSWLMLAQLYERAGLLSDAERAFTEAIERRPESGDALAGRGVVRTRGKDPAGLADLRAALRFGTQRAAEAQAILVAIPR